MSRVLRHGLGARAEVPGLAVLVPAERVEQVRGRRQRLQQRQTVVLPAEGRRRGGRRHGGRASASGGGAEGTAAAAMSEGVGRAAGATPCEGEQGGGG